MREKKAEGSLEKSLVEAETSEGYLKCSGDERISGCDENAVQENSGETIDEFGADTQVIDSDRIMLHYKGNMTVYNARTILDEFSGSINNYSVMNIDLSGVTRMDPSAIQLMIIAKRVSLMKNRVLRFINPSHEVMRIFKTISLDHYIED